MFPPDPPPKTFTLAADLGRPLPDRDCVVTIVEQWESVDALKAHFATPHMAAYKERTKTMVAGVQLQVVEPV